MVQGVFSATPVYLFWHFSPFFVFDTILKFQDFEFWNFFSGQIRSCSVQVRIIKRSTRELVCVVSVGVPQHSGNESWFVWRTYTFLQTIFCQQMKGRLFGALGEPHNRTVVTIVTANVGHCRTVSLGENNNGKYGYGDLKK